MENFYVFMSTHVPINGNQSRAHELVKVFAFLYINAYVFLCFIYLCLCLPMFSKFDCSAK